MFKALRHAIVVIVGQEIFLSLSVINFYVLNVTLKANS
jgi:hypothetical protein